MAATATFPSLFPTLSEKDEHLMRASQMFDEQQKQQAQEREALDNFAAKINVGARYPTVVDAGYGKKFDGMTLEEQNRLKILYANQKNSVESIVLGPNGNPKGLGGHLLTLDPSAIVTVADVIDLSAPFSHILLVKTGEKAKSLIKARNKYADLLIEAMSTIHADSPTLDIFGRDKTKWSKYFPRKEASIGLYAHKGHVFIIMKSHAGENTTQEIANLLEKTRMTAHEFCVHPEVKWLQEMSVRNTRRVVAYVARKLGLQVETIKDHQSVKKPHRDYPLMARDYSLMFTNSYRLSPDGKSSLFFHQTTDGSRNRNLDGVLIHGDPIHGFAFFKKYPSHDHTLHHMIPGKAHGLSKKDRKKLSKDEKLVHKHKHHRHSGKKHKHLKHHSPTESTYDNSIVPFGIDEKHSIHYETIIVFTH